MGCCNMLLPLILIMCCCNGTSPVNNGSNCACNAAMLLALGALCAGCLCGEETTII